MQKKVADNDKFLLILRKTFIKAELPHSILYNKVHFGNTTDKTLFFAHYEIGYIKATQESILSTFYDRCLAQIAQLNIAFNLNFEVKFSANVGATEWGLLHYLVYVLN